MSKTIYIPAFSCGALNVLLKKRTRHPKTNKLFNFYTPHKENMFNYPYLLLSAHYNLKADVKKDYYCNLKDTLILGDSGGYQIASGVLEFTNDLRKQIFEWLENNTTYAVNLDLPPYISNKKLAVGNFDKNLEQSVENFKYFAKHQTGKTKFLNVLQGRDIKSIQKWYDRIKQYSEDFTGGWSIGSASATTYNILLSLSFLFQNGEFDRLNKKDKQLIHILGLSKPKDMVVLSYLVKKLDENGFDNLNITYDSSTPQTAGVRSNYIYASTPSAFKWMQFSNQIKHEKNINYDAKLPCTCPVCKTLTLKDLYDPSIHVKDSLGPMYYGYLVMHNLFMLIDFKYKMDKIIDTDSKIIMDSIFDTKIQNVFKIVDKIVKNKNRAINIVLQNKKILLAGDDFVEQNINKINNLF